MNTQLLIDAIVHQTTVLIAQLSTAAGIRAPLAHVADQVFLELSRQKGCRGIRIYFGLDKEGQVVPVLAGVDENQTRSGFLGCTRTCE